MPVMVQFAQGRRQRAREQREQQLLRQELQKTRVQIHQAYAGFNLVKDESLIESFIFEIKSLQARYNYLLRQAKALEGAV